MPAQTFTASAIANASRSHVWARLQVPETWESISGVDEVFDPRHEDVGLVGFKFHSVVGGRRYVGSAKTGPREVDESLVWEIATTEIAGSITVDLAPAGDATRVDVTMHVESVSIMATFGFPLIAGAIASGFQETTDRFARSLEA